MRIGEAAERLSIPASTIRYYEKQGLLPALDRVSGVREFDSSALAKLRFIKLGQAAGFTIQELRSLLERYKNKSAGHELWQPEVKSKRIEIQKKIEELKQADAMLEKLMSCRCKTLEDCVDGGC